MSQLSRLQLINLLIVTIATENMQNQYRPNILFLGNSRVGKTTLIGRMSGHDVYAKSSKPTIRSDFVVKNFTIGRPPKHVELEARLHDLQFDLAGSPPSVMRYCCVVF